MSGMKQSRRGGYVASLVVTFISVALTLFLVVNRQAVIDQVTVWQYQPSAEIAAFAERSGMNDRGRFIFYASQPNLEGTQAFNAKCSRIEQSTAVLGCYDGRNIFVYDVPNEKLDGIREVTSAHEMLHAAYLRLNEEQKQKVDALVEAEYKTLQNDAKFAERMAFYARTEPGERDNELHSIIGTEVTAISPELEKHYANYFTDRTKVVALHAQYASVFASLQARGDELSAQLTALADSIEASVSRYNSDVQRLNNDIADFNARANSGSFGSQEEFEKERSALIARANELDRLRRSVNDMQAQYEALRIELEAIASQSDALNRSIDSSLAPAPSL